MTVKENALHYLYSALKASKIAFERAKEKPNVDLDELINLENKIAALDWIIPLAIKGEDE